jgi:hypothetical protein
MNCGLLIQPLFLSAQTPDPKPEKSVETEEPIHIEASSRTELLTKRRELNRANLVTPEESVIEKQIRGFDRKGSYAIEDTNFYGFHPRLDWIARGSGAAAGVRYWKPEALGPMDLMGSAFYSWRRYQLYDFQFGFIPNRGKRIPSKSFETEQVEELADVQRGDFSKFKLYFSGRWRDRTDESFYGSGPDTNKEDRKRYRVKDSLGELVAGYQFGAHFSWTFMIGAIHHSLARGRSSPPLDDYPNQIEIPGKLEPPNYFRTGTSLLFDFRDDPGVPHSGFLVAFAWEKWDNTNTGNIFNFYKYSADVRGFIPLGSRQRVIALRGVFVDSDPGKDNLIPFFLQPSLGGGESLRGFEAYRFQGDKLALVQGEYRWEASQRIEFALFMDTGTVANQGDRLSVHKLKTDWGIGFRIKSSRQTLFRIDQAFSNEGPKTQFRFSAVF